MRLVGTFSRCRRLNIIPRDIRGDIRNVEVTSSTVCETRLKDKHAARRHRPFAYSIRGLRIQDTSKLAIRIFTPGFVKYKFDEIGKAVFNPFI